MPKSNSTTLVEELLKTIERVGIKKTIERLKDTTHHLNNMEVLQEFIISKSCQHFLISKNMFLTGRRNTHNRTNAIGVSCLLLSRHCKIPQTQIAKIIRKDNSNVNKYIKKFDNLDPKFKEDLKIIKIIEVIDNEITDFTNELNIL